MLTNPTLLTSSMIVDMPLTTTLALVTPEAMIISFLVISGMFAAFDAALSIRKEHFKGLMDAEVSPCKECHKLQEHLTVHMIARQVMQYEDSNVQPIKVKDVLSLLRFCELILLWTGILPILCYIIGCIVFTARGQLFPSADLVWQISLWTGALIQVFHHYLTWRIRLYPTLFRLGKRKTSHGPIWGYISQKIEGPISQKIEGP
ncbi:MAG: hypothetical protein O7G85_03665 [Planctomycetota bacterium]|nr:hypothetical protein [Planctomycetota bacterium]